MVYLRGSGRADKGDDDVQELVFPRLYVPVVERTPDAVAVISDDGDGYRATFAQHLDRVLRLKRGLGEGLGLGKDDRYAVLAGNSHRYLELWHAALFGGGVINPLNTRLAPAELEYILSDSETRVVFADSTFAPVIEQLRDKLDLERIVLLDDGDAPHDLRYEDLVAGHEPAAPDEPDEEDLAVLMYTGGTTGLPKGVLLQQRALTVNLYHLDFAYRYFTTDDVCLVSTPMFHIAGCLGVMGIPASGNTVVLQNGFHPGRTIAAAETYGVTLLGVVVTMLAMVLDHPDFAPEKFSALRCIGYGGSPMPSALQARVLDLFPDVELVQLYGMTETSAVLTCLRPSDHRAGGDRVRSVGRPLPGVRIRIQDPETDAVLPAGQAGEIVAQSGSAMVGYHHLEEETARALRNGWYHTGDMGYVDEAGYLFITDRVKDMIVTGGENVYSVEVENALASHPAVQQVAVIGIPSEQWGEAVHAVVVLRPDTSASEDELKAHVRERLAGYKVPKSIEFRTDPLPLSAAMKVLKRELRAPYWEGRERNV